MSSVDYTMPFISIMSSLWGHRHKTSMFVVKPEQVLTAFWSLFCVAPTFSEELRRAILPDNPSMVTWDCEKQQQHIKSSGSHSDGQSI